MSNIIPIELIEKKIFVIRERKVMIDRHLAELYCVETRVLNQAVKRNIERFPEEFMFQLTMKERDEVVTICDDLKLLKFFRTMPYAFSEYGVAMLSSVINSKRSIQVNIQIIKAFVKLRQMILGTSDLRKRIEDMEKKYDKQFKVVFTVLKELIDKPFKERKEIGFKPSEH